MCAPESDALRARPGAARRVRLDLSGGLGRGQENIFRCARVGTTRPTGSGILPPGNSGNLFAPVSPLPQRPGADRGIADGRARYSDGDGVAEVSTRIAALLHIWRHRPRMPRCGGGAPNCPGMPTVPPGDFGGPRVLCAI